MDELIRQTSAASYAAAWHGEPAARPLQSKPDTRTGEEASRVTVVDSSHDFRDLVREILDAEGYETALVDGDRDDVLPQIRRSRPHLLMIDLRFGDDGLSGWATARHVRAQPELGDLPLLVCSADLQALAEIGPELAAMGHASSLTKPFEIDALPALIRELLDGSSRGGRRPRGHRLGAATCDLSRRSHASLRRHTHTSEPSA